MAVIATGQKTIIDLSDGKSVTVYLSSNLPKTQVKNNETNVFNPNWSSTNLQITANVSVNGAACAVGYTSATGGCSFEWKRRDGSGSYTTLAANETVGNSGTGTLVGDRLTVSSNNLGSSQSGLITYQVKVTYTDKDTKIATDVYADVSYSLVATGAQPHGVTITGDQVFKYVNNSPYPSNLSLAATLQNSSDSIVQWEYYDYDAAEPGYSTIQESSGSNQITISPISDVWASSGPYKDIAKIRVVATAIIAGNPTRLYDEISLYKVRDGEQGQGASVVLLTNEMITFPGDNEGYVANETSFTCNVTAFTGTTKVTPTIDPNKIQNNKIVDANKNADIDVVVGSVSDNEIQLTVKTNKKTNLGAAGECHGQIKIPIMSPVTTNLILSWGKVNTGETGASGENAIVMSVYAPNGAVFTNQEGTKRLQVSAYDGSTDITQSAGVEYEWSKYIVMPSPDWQVVGSDYYYDVSGSEVESFATFKCEMTYNGTKYSDCIDVLDKTDPYQATIESTGGDIFKNTQGTSFLICRIWQGIEESDSQKTTIYSTVNPPTSQEAQSASEGSYCYYCPVTDTGSSTPKMTALLKKTSSGWVTAPAEEGHSKVYMWARRNANGDEIPGVFAYGKVIYVDGSDVDTKTTFTCAVGGEAVS